MKIRLDITKPRFAYTGLEIATTGDSLEKWHDFVCSCCESYPGENKICPMIGLCGFYNAYERRAEIVKGFDEYAKTLHTRNNTPIIKNGKLKGQKKRGRKTDFGGRVVKSKVRKETNIKNGAIKKSITCTKKRIIAEKPIDMKKVEILDNMMAYLNKGNKQYVKVLATKYGFDKILEVIKNNTKVYNKREG